MQMWQLKNGDWSESHPRTALSQYYQFVTVGDPAAGDVLAFGGCCAQTVAPSQTWIWNGSDWTEAQARVMPSNRLYVHLAYDVAIGHIVLFGGDVNSSGSGANDLWIWDGSTWVAQHPKTLPPSDLANSEIGYDAAHKTIVLLLRSGKSDVETWTWDGKDWSRQYPTIDVPTRVTYRMAWDDATQQLVLYDIVSASVSQTYIWTGTDWQRMA
ncbi:MAG: hypothetical protein E6I88_07085 [Chloroflexi bacterium]|nr:MAG: hypothetical protein E6I88_07085 [Chloroflexota bacterium]